MSCSKTQRSASGEARTRNPSISGQALYHDCAPQLGSILCRYDTCPTQYAPDLRGSILCMQGTQYAPRESILCMEHFVALQSTLSPGNCTLAKICLLSSIQGHPPIYRLIATFLPAKSDSEVMLCLQSYHGLIIDRSLGGSKCYPQDRINTQVIYRFSLPQVECTI